MNRTVTFWAPIALMTTILALPAVGADSPAGAAEAAHMAGGKHEKHPAIHKAMREVREAKAALEKADKDFGGHRVKAIEHLDQAMAELEQALQADKN